MERIYLDHAATTPIDASVFVAMRPYLEGVFGNPSSIHSFGREARAALDGAHDAVARCLGARAEEIFFTSGGTESDNTVLKGVAAHFAGRGNHIVTSAIEHHAVLDTCEHLEGRGVQVTTVPVDGCGLIDPEEVRRAIAERTVLVSIMFANNEIGTIQPVAEIGRICREAGVLFHTDAVQAAGALPIDVDALNVDFLSLSGHKFYGPKGVGVLYARRRTKWESLLHGGGQERARRAGTENVAGIVGLAHALELAVQRRDADAAHLTSLRDRLIERVLARVERCHLSGDKTRRLPNNASFAVEGVEGEAILMNLDMAGIAASSGSACSAGSLEPSHVLKAIGLPPESLRGSLRLTLGRGNTAEQIDTVADTLAEVVERLRGLSAR